MLAVRFPKRRLNLCNVLKQTIRRNGNRKLRSADKSHTQNIRFLYRPTRKSSTSSFRTNDVGIVTQVIGLSVAQNKQGLTVGWNRSLISGAISSVCIKELRKFTKSPS
jgi:hypothetical protein